MSVSYYPVVQSKASLEVEVLVATDQAQLSGWKDSLHPCFHLVGRFYEHQYDSLESYVNYNMP